VLLGSGDPRFRDDDGTADTSAAVALAEFAASRQSEQVTLMALAGTRLLVPVVAVLTEADAGEEPEAGPVRPALRGEKASEMALPKLVGRDGRSAIPVFTSLDSLARWQASARPVPADAAAVWRAAVEESAAVIIDVAGPVPLAVEGARLAALASGAPVPPPHEDPDVRQLVGALVVRAAAAAGSSAAEVRFALRPPSDGGDLLVELVPPADLDQAATQDFAARVGSSVAEHLAFRLRRGIAVALAPPSP
jgi:hypothetical protein